MANSIFKVHEMINKVGFEFDDATAKKVTQLAEKAGKLAADNMTQELSAVVAEIGGLFNQALSKLGKEQIDLADMIKMPDSSTIGKLTSNFVSQIAGNISDGIVAGINNGIAKTDSVVKQLDALQKRYNELTEKAKHLDKRYAKYEYLADISSMDISEFKPLKAEEDLDKQAERLMGAFVDAEDRLSETTRGTKEYYSALTQALEAANNLYRMSRTLSANKGAVKDKSWLEDYSFVNLSDTTFELFEKSDIDFNKYLKQFNKYYTEQLKAIKLEKEQIVQDIERIKVDEAEFVDQDRAKTALKTLNEIEEAYNRILNKNKSLNKKKSKDILSTLEYVPGSESLATLKHGYDKSFSSNENWEIQYQWLTKFVKEYEAYANSPNVDKERLRGYTALYEQLKPMAENAENMLRNVLNMANNIPLVGMDGESIPDSADKADANETERKAQADKEAAEATAKARVESEAKAKADAEAAEATRNAAEEAEKEQLAKEAAAQARREELVNKLNEYGGDVLDSQSAHENIQERERILQQLKDEDLLTEEIENNYNKINEKLKARAQLLFEAETHYDDIDDVLTGLRVDAIDSGDQYRKDQIKPFDNVISQMESSGFFSEEELDKFNAISEAMEARARDLDIEASFDKLDELYDTAYDVTDANKLNEILKERKQILQDVEFESDYADEIEHQKQINAEIEKRVALLRDAQAGLIDVDNIDDILKENGDLQSKLDRLGDVAYDWGAKIKDGEEDDAIDELEAFEETYDRIVLKLANGRNIEILPNAKGLRALYKYNDGMDPSAYGETEIDDVVFERVKVSADAAEQAVDGLNDSLEKQNVIEKTDNDSAEVAEENAKTDAINRENEALKENINLQAQASGQNAGMSTGGTGTPAQTLSDGVIASEAVELEAIRAKVIEVTDAINTKTQAFKDEAIAVNTAVDSEVAQLDELEQKIVAIKSTLEGLLNNIKTGQDDIGAGLSNIVVNVNHADTQQNDLSPVIDAISRISLQPTAVADVGNVLATENTLSAIKTAVESINGKVQQGVRGEAASKTARADDKNTVVRYEAQADSKISGNGGSKPTEKINTALTALLKYKTTLQEANQLSGDLEVGINNLYAELSQVSDKEGLTVWSEHFKQFKNASSIIQTLVKDYQVLGALQAKADAETDPTKLAHYLDNIQILQDRIDIKSVDVNVGDDRFEEAYQRAYGIERHALQQKQELTNANQVEAEVIKRLVKLYEQLGRARATGNMMEVSRVRGLIRADRSQLASVDYATDMQFKAARDKGYNDEQAKSENAALKEQETTINNLINLYQKLGDFKERAVNADEGMAEFYNNEARKIESQIIAETQKLDIVSDALQKRLDDAYDKGKDIAQSDILKTLYSGEDKDRKQAENIRNKDIEKLAKSYEKFGKLQTEYARTGSLKTEHDLNILKDELNAEAQRLGLTRDQIAALETRRNLARVEAEQSLDAEEREKIRLHYIQEEEKALKKRLQQAKQLAQKEAMVGPAGSAVSKAEKTWMSAMSLGDVLPSELQVRLDAYYEQLDKLRRKQAEVKNSDTISEEQKKELIQQTQNVNQLTKEFEELLTEYQRLSGDNVKEIGTNVLGDDADMEAYKQQLSDAVMAATNGKAQIKGFDATTKTLTYTVKTGANEFTQYTASVRGLDGALVSVQGQTKRTETIFEGLRRKTKEILMYFGGSSMIYKALAEVKKGIQYVREIDSALTELKKVTDETEESYERFLNTAAKTADKVGSTIKEIVSSTADWARLNI